MKKFISILLIISLLMLGACTQTEDSTEESDVVAAVIDQFTELAAIPRPSGHEKEISDYLVKWAEDRNLSVTQNEVYDVIIDVPATEGMDDKPTVALQAHMDMVFTCAEGLDLDPLTTSIVPEVNGDYLTSDGRTSLGADNGIGLSVALNIADGLMAHGPLRLFITVAEETTSLGVKSLSSEDLEGIDYLINLDDDIAGETLISCAASERFVIGHAFETINSSKTSALQIKISGLAGGHSGVEIYKNGANAIRLISAALNSLTEAGIEYEISELKGGSALNVITDNCSAVIRVDEAENAIEVLSGFLEPRKDIIKDTDPDYRYEIEEIESDAKCISAADSKNLESFFLMTPNGVSTWMQAIPDMPESSSNIGVAELENGKLYVGIMSRGSTEESLADIREQIGNEIEVRGYYLDFSKGADYWAYDPDNKLTQIASESYQKLFGEELKLVPIHAAVECGTFARLRPGINMISLGAEIQNCHLPTEACDIDSIAKLWKLVEDILNSIEEV